jgi:hypothetical protein
VLTKHKNVTSFFLLTEEVGKRKFALFVSGKNAGRTRRIKSDSAGTAFNLLP